VVAIIRKVMGWHMDTIIEEYTTYAYPKTRESDMKYIHGFDVQSLSQAFPELAHDITSKITYSGAVSRARMVKIAMAILMLLLWAFTTVQLRP
jgi:tyrosine-protein phosphatase SIW14